MTKCSLVMTAVLAMLSVSIQAEQDHGTKTELNQQVQQSMSREVAFEDMVPPGMSIEAKEVSREGSSGNSLIVQYHIFPKGAPETVFRHISWPINADQPQTTLTGITLGKDGILTCAGRTPEQCGDKSNPDDPIEFTISPIKGEPSRFAFIAPNIRVGLVIVPDPITSTERGCSLSAVRLTNRFELAYISGTGYKPDTDVHVQTSPDTTGSQVVRSDNLGRIRLSLIPDLKKRAPAP